jgi:ketosteroid isomerase-like protein
VAAVAVAALGAERDTAWAMSEENVEIVRRSNAAYNEAVKAPNPREAIRAWLERFSGPEIEWELDPIAVERHIYHGIDGVMEFFEMVLETFEQVRQVPERFIDCGDQVLMFVRTEARGRTAGLDIDEEWAYLVTVRDGKSVRVQQFRDRHDALEAAGLSE